MKNEKPLLNLDNLEKVKKEILDWYSRVDVKFEVVKALKGRECAFLGIRVDKQDKTKSTSIRHMKIHAVKYLEQHFKAFNFFNRISNIYGSLAHYKDLPVFSFNPVERKKQQNEFKESEKILEYITGYDLGIDFDAHDKPLRRVYDDLMEIHNMFNEFKVPHKIKTSGSGFHLEIPDRFLPKCDIKIKVEFIKNFVNELWFFSLCDTMDRDIYNYDRLWKCPYSYDWKSGNIAMPLTEEQLQDFTKKYSMSSFRPENIDSIRDRGEFIFNEDHNGLKDLCKAKGIKWFDELDTDKQEEEELLKNKVESPIELI